MGCCCSSCKLNWNYSTLILWNFIKLNYFSAASEDISRPQPPHLEDNESQPGENF